MKSIWLFLIFATIAAGLLPIIRFRKTTFFVFFVTSAFIDPLIIIVTYLFHLHPYWFIPFVTVAILLALPIKSKKNIIISLFSALILLPSFKEESWIPLLISSLNSFFIIYFLSEKILEEYKLSSSVSLFLPVLWFDSTRNSVKIYLFYRHIDLFTQLYTGFLILGLLSPIILFYLGYSKKYFFRKKITVVPDFNSGVDEEIQKTIIPAGKKKLISLLSGRELEVLEQMGEGLGQKEIAARLFVGNQTIYFHIRNMKAKLEVDSTPALYKYAFEMKMVIVSLLNKTKNHTHIK